MRLEDEEGKTEKAMKSRRRNVVKEKRECDT